MKKDNIQIDPVPLDELTLGEIDDLEENSRQSIDMIAKLVSEAEDPEVERMPKGRIFRALALIQLRRTEPDATWEDTHRVVFTTPQSASADPEVVAEIAGKSVGNEMPSVTTAPE